MFLFWIKKIRNLLKPEESKFKLDFYKNEIAKVENEYSSVEHPDFVELERRRIIERNLVNPILQLIPSVWREFAYRRISDIAITVSVVLEQRTNSLC